jgi:signal transduction histidine kinase
MMDWKRRCEVLQQELLGLVHAVSHDLRAPLRAADGFSRVLLTRHAEGLEPQAVDYLQRVRAATALMGSHIDALSRLARVSTAELRPQRVDLAVFARAALDDWRESAPARQVEAKVAQTLEAQGDPALLRTLVQNLVGNAWKFTRDRPLAHLEVGRASDEPDAPFFVRDDGAGFDLAFARHLFEPFGRLHPEGAYEGAGIGLAVCRRIVNRHGGRLWAEATPGQGARFLFTLGEPEVEGPGPERENVTAAGK